MNMDNQRANNGTIEFTVDAWEVVSESRLVETPIFTLFERTMRLRAGKKEDRAEGDFYILDTPDWINVIALTEDGKIILVEQFRYGIEEPTLEIPGGMVDPGESPAESARRELLEETGYRSDSWKSLGKVSANPAIMSNYTHLYLAAGCTYRGAENPDEHERIHVHTMPVDRFLELVTKGAVHHAIVVAAVAKYLLASK